MFPLLCLERQNYPRVRQHRRGAATASHEGDLFLIVRLRSDIPKNRLSNSQLNDACSRCNRCRVTWRCGDVGEDERLSVCGCSPSQLHKGAGAA